VPKVAMIGAGSTVFARRLMIDILSWPELAETTIALMDIDPARLDLVAQQRLPARIGATTDRRAALDGADYVVVMIQVGGLELFERDVAIPRRYGIDQTAGDTRGPGGIVRGPRHGRAVPASATDHLLHPAGDHRLGGQRRDPLPRPRGTVAV
jgi:alpha-galactosidase